MDKDVAPATPAGEGSAQSGALGESLDARCLREICSHISRSDGANGSLLNTGDIVARHAIVETVSLERIADIATKSLASSCAAVTLLTEIRDQLVRLNDSLDDESIELLEAAGERAS